MSKFKVGDYVSVRARIVAIDGSECEYPLRLHFGPDEDDATWAHRSTRLKLLVPKRKPATPGPDRVVVAAALMSHASIITFQGDNESNEEYFARVRAVALREADALIAEGAK